MKVRTFKKTKNIFHHEFEIDLTAFRVSTFSFTRENMAPLSKVSLPRTNFLTLSRENDARLVIVAVAFWDDFVSCCEEFC